ncbi:hypothetical protein NMY22_g8937 [Coprinellus aureogranulatus]|nr:hypothetical protein NMY22_g8937 [Coprinellus aureogranulatus]
MSLNDTSGTSTEDLVARAKQYIAKFALSEQRFYRTRRASMDLDRVLEAMMSHAGEAGGDTSRRYVASEILACGSSPNTSGSLRLDENGCVLLRDLAIQWLTNLLFVFKAPHRRDRCQRREERREYGFEGASESRPFVRQLLLREGYHCAVSEAYDHSHPCLPESCYVVVLQACHILPRALGDLNEGGQRGEEVQSLSTTLDILFRYTHLHEIMSRDELASRIHGPENGLLLDANSRTSFDNLEFGFEHISVSPIHDAIHVRALRTEKGDTYKIKLFAKRYSLMRKDLHAPVTFKDCSSEIEIGHPKVPLPNPTFLTIHLVIAKIVHESGADDFFRAIFWQYDWLDVEDFPHMITWRDLEQAMFEEDAREELDH